MSTPWRVLIADDHAITRHGLRLMAESSADVEIVGEARTGREAVEFRRLYEPDVVIIDLDMPEGPGLEAIRTIKAESPQTKILVLTVDEAEESIIDALQAGANGYLSKSSRIDDLRVAFARLAEDGVVTTPSIARKLVQSLTRQGDGGATFTRREKEVLEQLGKGFSARRIASELGIREGTVNTHIGSIYRKLGVNNRVDAVREAMKLHIIRLPG